MFHIGAKIPGSFPRPEGTGDTSRVFKVADLDDGERSRPELESIVQAWCDCRDRA
jgi:hypothetical protein